MNSAYQVSKLELLEKINNKNNLDSSIEGLLKLLDQKEVLS